MMTQEVHTSRDPAGGRSHDLNICLDHDTQMTAYIRAEITSRGSDRLAGRRVIFSLARRGRPGLPPRVRTSKPSFSAQGQAG